ncbi:MAG: hypothetical protein L0228_05340 [Planctomycetes bacterium]|nr:hypothetical protein [Planctomycetota bacterium]
MMRADVGAYDVLFLADCRSIRPLRNAVTDSAVAPLYERGRHLDGRVTFTTTNGAAYAYRASTFAAFAPARLLERYSMITPLLHNYECKMLRRCRGAAALTVVVLLLSVSPSLKAQVNAPCSSIMGSWCLRISEKEKQLVHDTEPEWMKPLMWDLGITRNDYYRNMPTLELSNIAAAGSPDILKFQMTIGDTRFHFSDAFLGVAALLGESTQDEYDLTSSISPDGHLLTVNIQKQAGTGGLAPGDLVRFRIDLNVDAGLPDPPFYMFPDFRTVLFDMNGVQVYGIDPAFPPPEEDNAQASVFFSDSTMLGPKPLPDFEVTGLQSQYFNAIQHPRGVMEGVDIFTIGGGPPVIPEPGSAALAVLGLLGLLSLGARKCRAATTA